MHGSLFWFWMYWFLWEWLLWHLLGCNLYRHLWCCLYFLHYDLHWRMFILFLHDLLPGQLLNNLFRQLLQLLFIFLLLGLFKLSEIRTRCGITIRRM